MNKLILLLVAAASIILAGCTGRNDTIYYAPGPRLKICATISPVYSMTAGMISTRQNLSLEQIIPPGETPSGYSLTNEEIDYYSSFDVCVISGMGYDDFVSDKLRAKNPKIQICNASEGIEPITLPDGKPNPYVWNSPVNQAMMLKNIGNFMIERDKTEKKDEKKGLPYGPTYAEYSSRFTFITNALAGENPRITKPKKASQGTEGEGKPEDGKSQAAKSSNIATYGAASAKIREFSRAGVAGKAVCPGGEYDYLLRDCGITVLPKGEQSKDAIVVATEGEQAPEGACLLSDVMREKKIMPDTCVNTTLQNISEIKRKFGEAR